MFFQLKLLDIVARGVKLAAAACLPGGNHLRHQRGRR